MKMHESYEKLMNPTQIMTKEQRFVHETWKNSTDSHYSRRLKPELHYTNSPFYVIYAHDTGHRLVKGKKNMNENSHLESEFSSFCLICAVCAYLYTIEVKSEYRTRTESNANVCMRFNTSIHWQIWMKPQYESKWRVWNACVWNYCHSYSTLVWEQQSEQ